MNGFKLEYGHRISIHLDLFGHGDFDRETILDALGNEFNEDFVYEEIRANGQYFVLSET